MGMIEYDDVTILQRIKLALKVLKTKGYSKGYTVKELIDDDF